MRQEQNAPGALGAEAAPAAVMGLLMAVLTAGDAISGAVVARYRRIGVLRSLSLSPAHVVAVDLSRVGWPALAGCFTGVVAGVLLCVVVLRQSTAATAPLTRRGLGRPWSSRRVADRPGSCTPNDGGQRIGNGG